MGGIKSLIIFIHVILHRFVLLYTQLYTDDIFLPGYMLFYLLIHITYLYYVTSVIYLSYIYLVVYLSHYRVIPLGIEFLLGDHAAQELAGVSTSELEESPVPQHALVSELEDKLRASDEVGIWDWDCGVSRGDSFSGGV